MKKIFLLLLLVPFATFAQKEYSEEAKAMLEKANTAYQNGDKAGAYALYEKCLGMEPKYVEAVVNMSNIKFESGNYEKALGLAQKAQSIEKSTT